jgi:hypothetical protein
LRPFCFKSARLLFGFAGAYAKGGIQGAKRNEGCEYKNTGQGKQYDAQSTRYRTSEIQSGDEDGNNHANGAVCIAHVLFHWIDFRGWCDLIIKSKQRFNIEM